MKITFLKAYLFLVITLLMSACGGSDKKDDDSSYPDTYLQFYNGAVNSALTYVKVLNGKSLGSATYGDVSSLANLDSGDTSLVFYRVDSDGKEIIIDELQTSLKAGEKNLLFLSGNTASPELNLFKFERQELTENFRLFASSVIPTTEQYDIYMAEAGDTFAQAHKLGTLGYGNFSEAEYWESNSHFLLGDYVVFLTLPGQTEPIFESASVNFTFSTEYVLVLRNTAGANSGNIEVDIIANSSTVNVYPDINQTAQYRIYNSLEAGLNLQVKLAGLNNNISTTHVMAKSLSSFVDLGFGDYRLSAQVESDNSIAFNNRFVTLNQGDSKAIILYTNDNNQLNTLSFNESTLPQIYDFQVQVVNLVADYASINIYFVRSGETLDTAKYQVSALNFAKNKAITLPADSYQVVVVVTQDDGQLLLDRIELVEFTQDTNNIITFEKDVSAITGYKIHMLF